MMLPELSQFSRMADMQMVAVWLQIICITWRVKNGGDVEIWLSVTVMLNPEWRTAEQEIQLQIISASFLE